MGMATWFDYPSRTWCLYQKIRFRFCGLQLISRYQYSVRLSFLWAFFPPGKFWCIWTGGRKPRLKAVHCDTEESNRFLEGRLKGSRDVGSIQKVGATCIQKHPHKQKWQLFKLQRGTLPNNLWKVGARTPCVPCVPCVPCAPCEPRFLGLWKNLHLTQRVDV